MTCGGGGASRGRSRAAEPERRGCGGRGEDTGHGAAAAAAPLCQVTGRGAVSRPALPREAGTGRRRLGREVAAAAPGPGTVSLGPRRSPGRAAPARRRGGGVSAGPACPAAALRRDKAPAFPHPVLSSVSVSQRRPAFLPGPPLRAGTEHPLPAAATTSSPGPAPPVLLPSPAGRPQLFGPVPVRGPGRGGEAEGEDEEPCPGPSAASCAAPPRTPHGRGRRGNSREWGRRGHPGERWSARAPLTVAAAAGPPVSCFLLFVVKLPALPAAPGGGAGGRAGGGWLRAPP